MSPHPLLSVVVPFYGVEDYLDACLRSLTGQTLTDLEVVLVDDGSLDGSRAIAERWVAQDPRVRLVTQVNAGLGPARNAGAAAAQGRYLAFVDSDDVVPAFAYERLLTSLEETGSDLASGGARRFAAGRGSWPSWLHTALFAEPVRATNLDRTPALARDRMAWNKVYRREFWERHDFAFPAIRYEDWPVTFAAYLAAESVDVVDAVVYAWRDRESGGSITQQSLDVANFEDRVTSAEQVLALAATAPPAVRREVERMLAQVDLVIGLRLFGAIAPEQRAALVGLVDRLARDLAPSALASLTRARRMQLDLLRRGATGPLRWVVRAQDAGWGPAAKSALRRIPGLSVPVTSTLESVQSSESGLRLTVALRPEHESLWPRDQVAADLVDAEGRTVPTPTDVRVRRRPGHRTDALVQLDLDLTALSTLPATAWPLTPRVDLRHGARRIRVPLKAFADPGIRRWSRLPSGDALHLDVRDGQRTRIVRVTQPVLATAQWSGTDLSLTFTVPPGLPTTGFEAVLVDPLGRRLASAEIRWSDATTGSATLDARPLTEVAIDDVVDGTSVCRLLVGADPAGLTPLLGDPASPTPTVIDTTTVRLTATTGTLEVVLERDESP